MEDAGIPPSAQMYNNILYFTQTRGGAKKAPIIKDRIGKKSKGLLRVKLS